MARAVVRRDFISVDLVPMTAVVKAAASVGGDVGSLFAVRTLNWQFDCKIVILEGMFMKVVWILKKAKEDRSRGRACANVNTQTHTDTHTQTHTHRHCDTPIPHTHTHTSPQPTTILITSDRVRVIKGASTNDSVHAKHMSAGNDDMGLLCDFNKAAPVTDCCSTPAHWLLLYTRSLAATVNQCIKNK